jgi:hypothetical protein
MTLNPLQFDPGQNPKQLRMLMTAPEIKAYLNESGDLKTNETMEDLWKRKLEESKVKKGRDPITAPPGSGIYRSLKRNGYDGPPIYIGHFNSPSGLNDKRLLADGHHRVASMAEIDPNAWIPVTHDHMLIPRLDDDSQS